MYKGKEYEAGVNADRSYILLSHDSNDLENGFGLDKRDEVYVKIVQRSELDEVYKITAYAEYKTFKFIVIKEDKKSLLLFSLINDYKINQSLGFDMIDKGVYQKWIAKNDVTSINIEKTPWP
jgi:hypothetical protein